MRFLFRKKRLKVNKDSPEYKKKMAERKQKAEAVKKAKSYGMSRPSQQQYSGLSKGDQEEIDKMLRRKK